MSKTPPEAAGPRLPAQARRLGRWQVLASMLVGGFVAVTLLLVGTLVVVHRGEALPGVTVEGVRVGGLGGETVRVLLDEVMASRQRAPITFVHGERVFEFSPGPQTYEAQIDDGVAAALRAGRTGNPLADAWAHIAALWERPIDLHLPDHVTLEPVRDWIDEVAVTLDRDPFPGRVGADPRTAKVSAEMPQPGARVRREEAVEAVRAAVGTDGPDHLTLPVDVIPQRVRDGEVQRLAAIVARALEAPLILSAGRAQVVLPPPKIARLISSRVVPGEGETDSLALDVTVEAVEEVFASEVDRINLEPRDASFEVLSPPARFDSKGDATWTPQPAQVRLVPSASGVRLDPKLTEAQLERLLLEGRRRAELEVEVVHPELPTQQAQGLGITQLIGSFTTHHQCCQPRVRNIHLIADMVRGAVIRPGETFSVNAHVGRRTRGKGFVEDAVIIKGELQDALGGGVSQFATTAYNAAFFAGLPIVESKAHSLYISRYPMGREATLNYGGIDLKFRNDTSHGVLVHTSYTATSITVSLYGNNGGRTVTAQLGQPYNFRIGPDGKRGFDVDYFRIVDYGGGRSNRQRFVTRYDG
ncbi:MAG: VanW family protein [Nitriliruptorales bacterium]